MKIAIASSDEQTISKHFGRAKKYVVYSVEHGQVIHRNTLPKLGHDQFSAENPGQHNHRKSGGERGFGHQSKCKHDQMVENIRDCDILLTRGMGRGAYLDLQKWGIKPIVTDIADIETAIQAVLTDTIIDHTEELH